MNSLLRQSQSFLKRNASTILTVMGGAGAIATAVMAVKATPKALRTLDEAKVEKGEELTKFEMVKVAGPAYIPAVIMGASTLACIFGANVLNKRSQASIASAYALVNESYKEYREKVVELYGKEVDTHIKHEIAKDKYKEVEVENTDGKELFYDTYSGRYFESTMEAVKDADYKINKVIMGDGGAFLNEYYEFLGLPPVDGGDDLGWSSVGLSEMAWTAWLDFYYGKITLDDGRECNTIMMSTEPFLDFEDFY